MKEMATASKPTPELELTDQEIADVLDHRAEIALTVRHEGHEHQEEEKEKRLTDQEIADVLDHRAEIALTVLQQKERQKEQKRPC